MKKQGKRTVLAIDFGASSGRAMLGILEDDSIHMQEIHRFQNDPVIVGDTMYWDVLRLYHEIKQSLLKAKQVANVESVAVDTWGVDFGLLGKNDKLIGNPVHYRDRRTQGILAKAFQKIEEKDFYQKTGIQFMECNTAFQLLSMLMEEDEALNRAHSLLLMPDLFHFMLSGQKVSEVSIASTTQLLDPVKKEWSEPLLQDLGISKEIFQPIVPSGTIVGDLLPSLCEELQIPSCKVIAVAGHDTQCAMAATPAKEKDFIFLSCGTWSLLGTELSKPIVNETSRRLNITNETGFANTTSFLKNITGLWLIQESRRQWIREGKEFSFQQLEEMAEITAPFACFIDPDAPEFGVAGNLPRRIQEYCEKTGQYVPKTEGEIVRCINESLALKYRCAVEEIKECTKQAYKTIYLLGGGTKSEMLCQMTANACSMDVSAGPTEATVLGNIVIQLLTLKAIENLSAAREIIRNSQDVCLYTPRETAKWESAYQQFKEGIKC